jgi:hypothetical protein
MPIPLVNGHRYTGTGGATEARWNFTKTAFSVSGYNNMIAGGSSVGNLSVTDSATGWTLVTVGSQWEPYAGSFFALNNGEGGSSAGSPTYTTFSANALQGGFLQAGHTISEAVSDYPFEFTNLPTGTYEVYVISSIKASVNPSLPNGIWYCKFGSASATSQTILEQANYTTPALMFSGSITSGQKIQFGPFSGTSANTDGVVANAVYIKKIA